MTIVTRRDRHRVYPTEEQIVLLKKNLGSSRFIYNNPSFPFADLSVLTAVRKNRRGGGRSKERPTLVEREDDDSYRFWWNDDDEEELAEYRQRCWKELEDAASSFITAGTEN